MFKNIIFSTVKKYDFTINYKSLYDLYAPIIGDQTIALYIILNNEADKHLQAGTTFSTIESLYKQLNLSYDSFLQLRTKLEAFQLLRTYVDVSKKLYYFELIEPLSFNSFIQNQKFRHLLYKSIGRINYERLEYLHSNNHLPKSLLNVSTNFDIVFKDSELKQIYEFNFNDLYENIIKKTHQTVLLNDQVKDLINFFFSSYSLTLSEIEHCVYNSIIHNQDKQFEVDYNLLQINFKKYIDESNNIDIFKQIKVNRNAKMFYDNLNDDELLEIFNSYQSLNSEHYYFAIKKTSLSDDELKIINNLRNVYHLNDSLINLMIDFSLNKTNGNLNSTYLYKMAKTANGANLLDITSLYQYLTTKKNNKINDITCHMDKKALDIKNDDGPDWYSMFNDH